MADNIAVNEGSGRTIAADEVGGALYQYVKPAFGADGTATLCSSTNPLPVALTNVEKAEDTAHTTADPLIPVAMVVESTVGGTSATDGDYACPTLNTTGAQRVQDLPHTSGGYSTIRLSDIDESEETIKASAGQLYGFHAFNTDGTNDVFIHFYDAANPDTSMDTPKLSFKIEAGQEKEVNFPHGIPFATAITVGGLTTWAPGATGPDANELNGTFWYM